MTLKLLLLPRRRFTQLAHLLTRRTVILCDEIELLTPSAIFGRPDVDEELGPYLPMMWLVENVHKAGTCQEDKWLFDMTT